MNLLHITCSPRGTDSHSSLLSAVIVRHICQGNPAAIIVERDLGADPPPHVDHEYAQALVGRPSLAATPDGARSLEYSDTLIGELEAADTVVIGTPMNNFTVPSVLKAWIDHVVRAHRTFGYAVAGKVGLLADRPVFVAIASGGVHFGDQASQPDFLTPYLEAILGTIGLHDVTFFRMQGLARGEPAIQSARLEVQAALQRRFALIG